MSQETSVENMELIAVHEPKGIEALDRAEIDIQIATAKKYPRSVTKSLDLAKQLITMDVETAKQAFYALPIQGTVVVGPSIRLAEILQSCWGNIEFGSAPLEVTDSEVKAVGYCRDRESNVSYKCVKSRGIRGRNGKRYPDHLITKTMLAAQAIAERDAICKVIPKAYVNNLFNAAMEVAESGESFEVRMQKAMGWFAEKGVAEQQVYEHLGVAGIKDLTPENVRYLRMLAEAIKQGEASIDELFGEKKKSGVNINAQAPSSDDQRTKVVESLREHSARIGAEAWDGLLESLAKKHAIKKNTKADTWPMPALLDLLSSAMNAPDYDAQETRNAEG